MIDQISIVQLFGRFDYTIELKNRPMTILTGPNGYGKSTILSIIEAVNSCNLFYFDSLPFKEIKFTFDDGNCLFVEKRSDKDKTQLFVNDVLVAPEIRKIRVPWGIVRHYYPNKSGDVFYSRHTVDGIDAYYFLWNEDTPQEMFDEIVKYNGLSETSIAELNNVTGILKAAKKSCGSTRKISEQRLVRKKFFWSDEENGIIDVITELPTKMKAKISEVTTQYSLKANSLDSTYPRRLLNTKEGLAGTEEFNERLEVTNCKFEKLSRYELAEFKWLSDIAYNDEFSKALKVYFDDCDEKYKIFEPFINKLDAFIDIVNKRLAFKKIVVDKECGITVEDDSAANRNLKLSQLSSGEKQEIILFYELIFESDKNLLLLIDEPEISLHIAWQRKFMDDLEKVVNLSEIQVIVATHSPQLINNRWDIQIDLGELSGR